MSDKALPALGADADKVGSESVKFWFWLASAAAKRNLRLGTASNAALASGDAALWYRARDDGVSVMAAMKSESLDA